MTDENYTLQMASYDRERTLDWLTALVPPLLISIFYYGGESVLLELLAVGGYLMTAALFSGGLYAVRLAPALMTGLLTAFCLPATTPYWPAALAGAVAAVAAAVPALLAKRWPRCPYAQPLVQPALFGYLSVRLLFPSAVDGFSLPALWDNLDGQTTATPLSALLNGNAEFTTHHLFFGIHADALGAGCAAAVVLAAFYLTLRRRLRLIAPVAMVGTVFLLSWIVWGAPLYGILCGGVALGALLIADRRYMPKPLSLQAASGVLAGALIVIFRAATRTDGTAAALVVTGLLQPILPHFFRFCRFIGGKLAPLWPILVRGLRRLWGWLCPTLGRLWGCAKALFCKISEKLRKNKNNG